MSAPPTRAIRPRTRASPRPSRSPDVVLDADSNLVAVGADGHQDVSAGVDMLQCVRQQVGDGAGELAGVGVDDTRVGCGDVESDARRCPTAFEHRLGHAWELPRSIRV